MTEEKDLADTTLLAAELTATLEEHGADAMFQKLENVTSTLRSLA